VSTKALREQCPKFGAVREGHTRARISYWGYKRLPLHLLIKRLHLTCRAVDPSEARSRGGGRTCQVRCSGKVGGWHSALVLR